MLDMDLIYAIALSHTLLSSAVLFRLVRSLGNSQQAWQASESLLGEHLKDEQTERLVAARKHLEPDRLLESYQQQGIHPLLLNHPDYPVLLKVTHDPPFILYARGHVSAFQERSLAIVGTRRFTDYGRRAVETLIEQISPHHPCIVSGLAAGIDTLAHQAALKHHLPTVAVFGTGIDQVYPRQNENLSLSILESGGALVSELPMAAHGDKFTFPRRNRIIAGMSQGTLVIEGNARSGALITARYALEENREVMAVPASIFSTTAEGPNRLIQEGASLIQSGQDILQHLNWGGAQQLALTVSSSSEATSQPSQREVEQYAHLSRLEQEILLSLQDEPTSFDAIQARHQEMGITQIQTALTMLELNGLVSAMPGAKFCRI